MTDFIIVGQGIAGTMLGWFLEKHSKSFVIIDRFNPFSSSQVAAGIIHPITGRRIVKTWMADTLIPFAESTYKDLEDFFSLEFFYRIPIIELIDNVKEYNDWQARSESAEMKNYISTSVDDSIYDEFLKTSFKKIIIKHTAWIDLKRFLKTLRQYFIEKDFLIEEYFDHSKLNLEKDFVTYKNLEARKIIFCEGVAAMQNPFWKHLPFIPAKGEMLTIRCPMAAKFKHIINKKIFILPLGDGLFKVGSTYNWNDLSETPTEAAKEFLLKELRQIIKVDFEVVGHEASVRPSVKDRRPFIGLHTKHQQIGIFNGLGSKGCLLAPYFANHLAGFLSGKNELMKEINVATLS